MLSRKRLHLVTLIALLPLGALAQTDAPDPVPAQPDPVPADKISQDRTYLRELDDIHVFNTEGERIGEIEEVLIDPNGVPASFVVEIGGFLDIGDYEVALPIDALTYSQGTYVSKMTEVQLENLPRWDERAD